MPLVHRVLSPHPISSLDEYLARGGGVGLDNARQVEPDALIDEIEASGLRGRGGAGFPTGRKWRTVAANRSERLPTTVVVNGAEGEPGTYKDRTILANDPYQVIEGALIAALAVGADEVVIATKASFGSVVERLRTAVAEMDEGNFTAGIDVTVFEGPDEYLFGEETALLESLDGRYPFPRIAPPYRRGVDEVVEGADDIDTGSGLSAHVVLAGPGGGDDDAAPTLVDNVETIANVARIIARGASWFRTEGTDQSPGTIVVTITGSTEQHAVGEVIMGTTLREAIELIGGGSLRGTPIAAVLSGVSNAILPAKALDTPLTYEDMAAAGGGLGSAGFIVLTEADDVVAVAAGAARFLAVESCGQCTPCKQDGLVISATLDKVVRNEADERDVATIADRATTVADGARCSIGLQQQALVTSLLDRFPEQVAAHVSGEATAVAPVLVAEIRSIDGDVAVLNERQADKQPDWSYDETDSGVAPADRFDEHRSPRPLDR
jgi:NADH:ubiquinone oxidoreductase subunit F (NADH-binding)